ncbi:hypothetical protein ACFSYG_07010 [Leeuwenhoekiella polynyae]|uniref:Cyclophilin-like domain-containing protein n=1 Tax=Leeuwenhoekiella polynyae TaxID=1550906 RepID=A0A4Q0P5H6_9FLAO|nr:hypothetical protein [Leeuwenhoekiella polynyae]RXG21864.1 hypothetical protein DSM02_2111 [Leeuwenhoekiella polynyae]
MHKALIFLFILGIQVAVAQTEDDPITITKGTQNVELNLRFSGIKNDVQVLVLQVEIDQSFLGFLQTMV